MRSPTSLRQGGTNINSLQLPTALLLLLMRHSIADNKPAELAIIDDLDRIAGQDAVGDDGEDLSRAVVHDRVGGFGQRAARVGHVIDEDGDLVFDVADEDHARDFVGALALFVDQGEGEVEAVGYCCCSVGGKGVSLNSAFWPPFPFSSSTCSPPLVP